jgi:H+/Cl- antiporter ClcA
MVKLKNISIIVLTCIIISLTLPTVTAAEDDPWDWYSDYYGGTEWAFFGIGLTMCLIFFLLPLIIAIIACIWIYKDAEKRGKSGAIWGIIINSRIGCW